MILEPEPCTWIGEGEKCNHRAMIGTAYCERHHERIYTVMPEEMADYIIEKELKDGDIK